MPRCPPFLARCCWSRTVFLTGHPQTLANANTQAGQNVRLPKGPCPGPRAWTRLMIRGADRAAAVERFLLYGATLRRHPYEFVG
jgi:hypothetical protein